MAFTASEVCIYVHPNVKSMARHFGLDQAFSTYSTTTTVLSSTPTSTTGAYVIVSPESCLSAAWPTGTPIGQSDSNFSQELDELQYQQFPGSKFIVSDGNETFSLDVSDPHAAIISKVSGDTFAMYDNGTFVAFLFNCQLQIVGKWHPAYEATKREADELEVRKLSEAHWNKLCKGLDRFCYNWRGSLATWITCALVGPAIGEAIGGGIGFLGNAAGPEVGIPTTLLGMAIGELLGPFACRFVLKRLLKEYCPMCRKRKIRHSTSKSIHSSSSSESTLSVYTPSTSWSPSLADTLFTSYTSHTPPITYSPSSSDGGLSSDGSYVPLYETSSTLYTRF